jgi:hypothetical protein
MYSLYYATNIEFFERPSLKILDIDLLIINHIINKLQSIPDKVLGPIKINFLTYKLNSMGEYTGTNDEFILKDGTRRFFNANGIDKMFILPIKVSSGLPVANFLHIRGHFIGKEVFQNEIHTL